MQAAEGGNVHVIERDLRNLWEQLAETPQTEGVEPVMRACVLNLIVYAPGEHAAEEVNQIMAEVTTQHPSRIFVILPKYETSDSALSAWVTALCHLSAGGHKQVCCEQIMITAEDHATYRLPNLVRSLLVPDLPVVLWWRGAPNFESRLFGELANASDRVIIDSALLQDSERELAALAARVNEGQRWTAFSDLGWSRLTPWRVAVAGLFDAPDWRRHLSRLNRVEIGCTPDRDAGRSIPSQALLIACWLASRLKWRPTLKPRWNGKDTYQLKLASEHLPVAIEIRVAPSARRDDRGLDVLRLVADGEPPARFVVSRSEDGSYLRTDAELLGATLSRKVVPLNGRNEAQLIAKELEILDRDAMFEQALAFFASLPK